MSNVDFKTAKVKKPPFARSIQATESDDGIRSYTDTGDETAEVLAIGSHTGTYQASTISPAPSSVATPPSSYYPSRSSTPRSGGAPGLTGRLGNRNGTAAYWCIWLSKEHTRCPWISDRAVESLMRTGEELSTTSRGGDVLYQPVRIQSLIWDRPSSIGETQIQPR